MSPPQTRGRVNNPSPVEENHTIQSRPSTASGTHNATASFSQPTSQPEPLHNYPQGSAESAVYEASLQLRNPNGDSFASGTQEQFQMNGATSRPSTDSVPIPQLQNAQQLPQYPPHITNSESQNTFGFAPPNDIPYHAPQINGTENIDPSLRDRDAPMIQRFNSDQFSRHSTPNDFGTSFQAFVPQNGGEPEAPKKRGAATSATNDKELRELLSANEGRTLKDAAVEVLRTERTPRSERSKQLFAMLWLRSTCRTAKSSVPRNRVYSFYADRCATERVVPLNPASFGKLVRVIFPGIQTRRLGVRGESKYHYVDLALEGDDQDAGTSDQARSRSFMEPNQPRHGSMGAQLDFNSVPHLRADTAVFPSQDHGYDSGQPSPSPPPTHQTLAAQTDPRLSHGMVFADLPHLATAGHVSTPKMYTQPLLFPSSSSDLSPADDSISLPPIAPFLPPRTDRDTASALNALYRTHCTSLIDCIRFCKEKQFFRLFTSFSGTLTVPVQKLFSTPSVAPWIKACDWMMYQKMVRFVAPLALQAAPPIVLAVLSTIQNGLRDHLRKTFANYPPTVLEAKMEPATLFCGLLGRLLRVNDAAHAAANLLTVDANREQMWMEWCAMVNPRRVMEMELPGCGYEEVGRILGRDVKALLEPLQNGWAMPGQQLDPYTGQIIGMGFEDQREPEWLEGLDTGAVSTENVLDRWSAFLSSLSGRFPHANARTILHCISAVGTAALRDITMAGGVSYSAWWVTKVFVDEMSNWLAALGGFLQCQSEEAVNREPEMIDASERERMEGTKDISVADTQSNGLGIRHTSLESLNTDNNGMQGRDLGERFSSAPPAQNLSFPKLDISFDSSNGQPSQPQDADLEDSGIGMGLMDDAFKFGIPEAGLTELAVGQTEVRSMS
ncbi:MAG: hypothetical protein M1820_009226 [Bogoriella megaspora]|nr:MAG: hypothetical protein M1820_009226 [Bogoriella megaspora]